MICAYRRDEANMPGSKREVGNAKEEGVEFLWNRQPLGIGEGADGSLRLHLAETRLGAPDEKGRRAAEVVEGSEQVIDCDHVVIAFGFQTEAANWIRPASRPTSAAAPWHRNSKPSSTRPAAKIFAGGGQVRGADLVVRAVFEAVRQRRGC